jgi:hypothetical protein
LQRLRKIIVPELVIGTIQVVPLPEQIRGGRLLGDQVQPGYHVCKYENQKTGHEK